MHNILISILMVWFLCHFPLYATTPSTTQQPPKADNTFFAYDGPNCYNTVLRYHRILEEDRYMSLQEFSLFLNTFFEPTEAPFKKGDILSYNQHQHVLIHLEGDQYFHKLDFTKQSAREILQIDLMKQMMIRNRVKLYPQQYYRLGHTHPQPALYTDLEHQWLISLTELYQSSGFTKKAHLTIPMGITIKWLKSRSQNRFFHAALDSFAEHSTHLVQQAEDQAFVNPFLAHTLKGFSAEEKAHLEQQLDALQTPSKDIILKIFQEK